MVVPHSNFPPSACAFSLMIYKETGYRQWILTQESDFFSFIDTEIYFIKQHTTIHLIFQVFDIQYLITHFSQWLENDTGVFSVGWFYFFDRQFLQCFLS